MQYKDFCEIISPDRMQKYVSASKGNTKLAMTVYRNNLRLSGQMFTVISCFEVALRNAINREMVARWGNDWLRDLVVTGGAFSSDYRVERTMKIIKKAYDGLLRNGTYTHTKLLSEMEFGVWKYMYSNVQYMLTGQILLRAFPNKPRSTRTLHYDNTYIFHELDYINNVRNRIAHHEPICFNSAGDFNSSYVLDRYNRMLTLFEWMGIDSKALLYGLDHVKETCNILGNQP